MLGPEAITTVAGRGYEFTLAASAPARRPTNLPQGLPALIGREADLLKLGRLLREHRIVTVAGPGGVGRTRLALAAAQCHVDDPEAASHGDVVLVELAGVVESTPVAEAVARALHVALPWLQGAADELIDVLRARPMLLVFDNCEHRLREAGTLVDRLVRGTAEVRVLTTNQQPLNTRNEQVFRLGTLALPDSGASAPDAVATGAVALLCERAAARNADFSIGAGQVGDAVAICRQLDGLPLAIELAAARIPLLGLSGLRERLSQHLKWLNGGPSDAPDRHQTLRAAIDWSHTLLDDGERRAFRGLGVLAGSFSVALAQRVLVEDAGNEWAALDRMRALLDKSLVLSLDSRHDGEKSRLRLLESTRAFALEQLHSAGEYEATMLRLARAILALFERSAAQRVQYISRDQVAVCLPDLDNLRAALDWLGSQAALADLHVELAGAAAWIWSRIGLRHEGLRRCRHALNRVHAQIPPALEACLQLGWVSLVQRRGEAGDCEAAERAAALYGGVGDRLGQFRALAILAFMRALRHEEDKCMSALEAMSEAFDPGWGEIQWGAFGWAMCASLVQFDRFDEIKAFAEEAHRLTEIHDSDPGRALYEISSAQLASVLGDFEGALEHAGLGLAAARRMKASGRIGMVLGDMATYLTELGRIDEAVSLAREALDLRSLDGTLWLQLDQLAQLACARGRLREAAMALGRSEVHNRWRDGRRERYLQAPFRNPMAAVAAAFQPDEVRALYTLV